MNIEQYLKEVRQEMTHVQWPSRQKAILYTGAVIAVALIVSLYTGGADYLFTQIIGALISG